MDNIYIYSGHSSIGNPSIINSSLTKSQIDILEIDQIKNLCEKYLYTTIPEGIRLITLYNLDQTTNINTTELLQRAIKNIGPEKFSEYIRILFDYSDPNKKVENINQFKKLLVSNFLFYSLNKNSKSKSYDINFFIKKLFPILSHKTISEIHISYQKTITTNSTNSTKAWTNSYLISLFKFDFINDQLIDMILDETKINLQIFKSGDKANYMYFDDLVFFKSSDFYRICYSGLYTLESYNNLDSIIWKIISKQQYKQTNITNLSDENYFLKEAYGSRSDLNIKNKFNRFYSLDSMFDKIGSGTFIIPSCGVINKILLNFIDSLEIDEQTKSTLFYN
jgi:hypothetical protein